METLFNIALKLRLSQKFWGDLFMWWQKRQTKKLIDSIDLDVKDIEFYEK